MSDPTAEPSAQNTADDATAPQARSAAAQLGYVLSLPERIVRGGSSLLGGALRESAAVLVPQSFQSSRTYTVMVRQMLDFLVHDVGRVAPGETPSSTAEIDNFVARKAVGNFVEMASLATLHLSPLVILAAVSDLAYGSQAYLKELADELKSHGVIAEDSAVTHINDLLSAVADASAATGKVFDTPPLSVDALKQSIEETRSAVRLNAAALPSRDQIEQMWQAMRDIAAREKVDLLAVSGATTLHSLNQLGANLGRGALSSIKVAGALVDRHIIDHYERALGDIRQRGLYATLAQTSQPYIAAVWENFRTEQSTLTEDVLSGKLLGDSWRAIRHWLGGDQPPAAPARDD